MLSAAGRDDEDEEIPLRRFELVLLEELGYGFDLASDGFSGEAVEEAWYHFHEEHGMVLAPDKRRSGCRATVGADLASSAAVIFQRQRAPVRQAPDAPGARRTSATGP